MATHDSSALSNDAFATHRRAVSYTYRVPTPPRIVIPPPIASDGQELNVERIVAPDDPLLDLSFLNQVDYSNLGAENNHTEWTYERRRLAQMVLPYLYLGPSTVAKDKDFLGRKEITMMLAVRPKATATTSAAFRTAAEMAIELNTIEAATAPALIAAFPHAIQLINRHLHKVFATSQAVGAPRLGKVLVFCETGNDKSAALVAAYLMEMIEDCNHIKAMQICQAQRFCVNFDDTMKQILQTYNDLLQARRFVAQTIPLKTLRDEASTTTGLSNNTNFSKRRMDDTYDDDMDDDMTGDDVARFEGRSFMPFVDAGL